ncbi:MAG: tetratricopeptide repeat protein [bacterium]
MNTIFLKNTIIIFLLFFSYSLLNGQVSNTYKTAILEGDSYFLYEEYSDALPGYLILNKEMPENYNIQYKIGVCFLNLEFEKQQALQYLERASKHINMEYRDHWKETKAPIEVLFELGNAYRVNNKLDEAIDAYNRFLEVVDSTVHDIQLVNDRVNSCQIAKKLINQPIEMEMINLGSTVNTSFNDKRPVINQQEDMIVFISELHFYDAIFYSRKENGKWITPLNMMPELGVDNDAYPVCLSSDSKELYVYRKDNYDGNIYVTKYSEGKWTPLEKLNGNINTKYWESHASLSKDGKTLYFTSNRPGGYGGLDIYISTRPNKETNEWDEPINLGAIINSRYNEETPFVTSDNNHLYFSSEGHYNMGGYDIFYSVKDSLLGKWSNPVNIGYPINTTGDELFFYPMSNGSHGYFSFYDPFSTFGKTDIYKINILSKNQKKHSSVQ